MLFPTLDFAVFFPIVFVLSWLVRPRPGAWRLLLLGVSLLFYGWWDWRYVPLLLGSVAGNWLFARLISATASPSARRLVVGLGVGANLAVLGTFKYYGFLLEATADVDAMGIPAPSPPLAEIIVPVGISFFTFQAISYLVDLSRGDLERLGLLDTAVYLAFFPQLVAGPIVRATAFIPQLRNRQRPSIPLTEATVLIVGGLFKKVVVSTVVATELVDPVFAAPGQATRLDSILAVYGYAIQIYADFSGYTDIAIGCALLLGFRFPVNFRQPYRAASLQDFWRRWHITLSEWLRDYLYIPLGGNRGGEGRAARNVMITMVLGGLWHGAAWTFVVWGALHGLGLAIERLARRWWRPIGVPAPLRIVLGWVWTFHVVCLAWIVFRADGLGTAAEVLGRVVGGSGGVELATVGLAALIAAAVVVQWLPARLSQAGTRLSHRLPLAANAAILAIGLTVVDAFGPDGVAPFIYFQF